MVGAASTRSCVFLDVTAEPAPDWLLPGWRNLGQSSVLLAQAGKDSFPARLKFGLHCRAVRAQYAFVLHLVPVTNASTVREAARTAAAHGHCALPVRWSEPAP